MLRAVLSTSAAVRLDAAAAFLRQFPASTEIVIVAATRGAADDFVRGLARRSPATFGLTRFGLTELAARSAVLTSALPRRAPATQTGAEALAARAAFDALTAGELEYFTPVASMPGFPRALARTLHEVRLAGIGPDRLAGSDAAAEDIGRLLARVEAELVRVGVDDRAALFGRAAAAVRDGFVRWASLPILLLDVPLDSKSDAGFVEALAGRAPAILATVPDGDLATESVLTALGAQVDRRPDDAREGTDLFHLRRHVFLSEPPPARSRAGDVRLFSAPGEGREAVEIVRRILDEAEPACRSTRWPSSCARRSSTSDCSNTRAPGPPFPSISIAESGARILRGARSSRCCPARSKACLPGGSTNICRSARCRRSAGGRRQSTVDSRPPAVAVPSLQRDVVVDSTERRGGRAESPGSRGSGPVSDSDDEAIVAGMLRAPWKWEELVVESAVVGGRTRADGGQRWRRRLDGLAADYRFASRR